MREIKEKGINLYSPGCGYIISTLLDVAIHWVYSHNLLHIFVLVIIKYFEKNSFKLKRSKNTEEIVWIHNKVVGVTNGNLSNGKLLLPWPLWNKEIIHIYSIEKIIIYIEKRKRYCRFQCTSFFLVLNNNTCFWNRMFLLYVWSTQRTVVAQYSFACMLRYFSRNLCLKFKI